MIKLTPAAPNDRVSTSLTAPAAREPSGKESIAKSASPSTEQVLTHARQSLGQLPEVDLNKVAEVKAALSRGEISLDGEALAHSILSFYQRSE